VLCVFDHQVGCEDLELLCCTQSFGWDRGALNSPLDKEAVLCAGWCLRCADRCMLHVSLCRRV
jgi:hypothetical protein